MATSGVSWTAAMERGVTKSPVSSQKLGMTYMTLASPEGPTGVRVILGASHPAISDCQPWPIVPSGDDNVADTCDDHIFSYGSTTVRATSSTFSLHVV